MSGNETAFLVIALVGLATIAAVLSRHYRDRADPADDPPEGVRDAQSTLSLDELDWALCQHQLDEAPGIDECDAIVMPEQDTVSEQDSD